MKGVLALVASVDVKEAMVSVSRVDVTEAVVLVASVDVKEVVVLAEDPVSGVARLPFHPDILMQFLPGGQ